MQKMSREKRNKKDEKKFVEFDLKSESFDFSGRVYPGEKKKNVRRSYMSLCLNGVFTISGCWLVETKDNTFISFPQYLSKDDEYKSYVFIDEEMREEMDNLAQLIQEKAFPDD